MRGLAVISVLGGLVACIGCTAPDRRVMEAFPPDRAAAPWILQDDVWSGSFDAAQDGLGELDVARLAPHNPQRVWIAKYRHAERAGEGVTVRILSFGSAADARAAHEALAPVDPKPYDAGDGGCWNQAGVTFHWGRLLIDVFGEEPSWQDQIDAARVSVLITKRMPAGAAQNPR